MIVKTSTMSATSARILLRDLGKATTSYPHPYPCRLQNRFSYSCLPHSRCSQRRIERVQRSLRRTCRLRIWPDGISIIQVRRLHENGERHTWADWMRLASEPLMACFSPPPEDLFGMVVIVLLMERPLVWYVDSWFNEYKNGYE